MWSTCTTLEAAGIRLRMGTMDGFGGGSLVEDGVELLATDVDVPGFEVVLSASTLGLDESDESPLARVADVIYDSAVFESADLQVLIDHLQPEGDTGTEQLEGVELISDLLERFPVAPVGSGPELVQSCADFVATAGGADGGVSIEVVKDSVELGFVFLLTTKTGKCLWFQILKPMVGRPVPTVGARSRHDCRCC